MSSIANTVSAAISRGHCLRSLQRCCGVPLLGVIGALLTLQVGCRSDSTGPGHLPVSQAYWALQLNAHAVNMALTTPANVVQLHASALTATGDTLAGRATFRTVDSVVSVDSTGRITAHYVTGGTPTQVVATLTLQGITLQDTALIQVDSTPRPLATFSIHPAAGDSAKCALDATCQLQIVAVDAHGDTLYSPDVTSILVTATSSDPVFATISSSGQVSPRNITHHVVLTASTLAYGVLWRDSVRYVIGYPISSSPIQLGQAHLIHDQTSPYLLSPATQIIGVGGIAVFYNDKSVPLDIVFDDSLSVQGINSADSAFYCDIAVTCTIPVGPGGNIAPWDALGGTAFRFRRFPVAGTYPYHSRLFGFQDTIFVSAGP